MNEEQSSDGNVVFLQHVPGRGMVSSALIKQIPAAPSTLQIHVVFTDMDAAEVALRQAIGLARGLDAGIRIIVPEVVPYPLPLESPAISLEFLCNKLRALAEAVGSDPRIQVYLCRDVMELLREILPTDSIVFLGERRIWLLPSRTKRIARFLRKNGCDVILARL